ncbi:hypothetical protein [Shewanella sp. 10N.286.54.B9]|uniref:hypothetical protein n=1 Tax=Shewanella sp. 10N.286.54.B9 TaxID=3229719 RepID=UPI00354C2061
MVGLGDIEAFYSLKDRFNKWRNPEPVVTNTAQRFIRLFEAHGVARAQIPRFFGHNLTLHQVEDYTELLKALSTEVVDAAATLFGIRIDWLEGGSEELYELKHFYKQPKLFGDWLDAVLHAGGNKIDGWLLTTESMPDEYDALILMREQVGELGEFPIYRYHFCELWIYGYWKCRADIAACVAQAWKRNCYIAGRFVGSFCFKHLVDLNRVPNNEAERTLISNSRFHAEDLTTNPALYSQGLMDKQFGIDSALERWLEYSQQGLMDSGFGDKSELFKDFFHDKNTSKAFKYVGLFSRESSIGGLCMQLKTDETAGHVLLTVKSGNKETSYTDKVVSYKQNESSVIIYMEHHSIELNFAEWASYKELLYDANPDLPRYIN